MKTRTTPVPRSLSYAWALDWRKLPIPPRPSVWRRAGAFVRALVLAVRGL